MRFFCVQARQLQKTEKRLKETEKKLKEAKETGKKLKEAETKLTNVRNKACLIMAKIDEVWKLPLYLDPKFLFFIGIS